jgi:hypothetical protein
MDIYSKQTHAHLGSRLSIVGRSVRIALAAGALAVSLGSQQLPAFAFNPQPDPPGMCARGDCGGPTQT